MSDKQVKPAEIKGTRAHRARILKHDVLEAIAHPGKKGGDDALAAKKERENEQPAQNSSSSPGRGKE